MSIIINQCLHGYKNGHQLLASSKDLTSQEKKILLFQSDLSGSNITKGFESYFTGYPIEESGIYVLSKTWYAEEMKRPGCVWTQSLLINFADLSIIPELETLLSLFQRPDYGKFSKYDSQLSFSYEKAEKTYSYKESKKNRVKEIISTALYFESEKTLIIPNQTSYEYDKEIFSIWSDQWPRLRRNFLFCTGALSLKTLKDREFDLQIVPIKNLLSIERQSKQAFVLDSDTVTKTSSFDKLDTYSKSYVRDFLWTFGSDLEGRRSNFVPLHKMLEIFNSKEINLFDIVKFLIRYFPSKNEAKSIKHFILGEKSPFNQKELIKLLTTQDLPNFIDFDELNIDNRLNELFIRKEISTGEVLDIVRDSQPNRITEDPIESLPIDLTVLFDTLNNSNYSKSFYKDYILPRINNNKDFCSKWLSKNSSELNSNISSLVFQAYDYSDLRRLDIGGKAWISIYKGIQENGSQEAQIISSCFLLSTAFKNEFSNSELIVAMTFDDVYRFASKGKIKNETWDWFPTMNFSEELNIRSSLRGLLPGHAKKKKNIAPDDWDYCEILIRNLLHLFVKFKWSKQAFWDALKSEEEFYRMFKYAPNYLKGYSFIVDLLVDVEEGKIEVTKEQWENLKNIKNL